MLLIIATSTFIVWATLALLIWAGLVLWLTGRSKTKKAVRPTPTLVSFFQASAGKISVDVPMPMASYNRNELMPSNQSGPVATQTVAAEPIQEQLEASASSEPALDDPTFAPAEPPTDQAPPIVASTAQVIETSNPAMGFRLSLDRNLLSRLLSDDALCEAFEEARAITLEQQRETGRPYATLFQENIAHQPTDVQAVLLNLLTEDEVDDFGRSFSTYS